MKQINTVLASPLHLHSFVTSCKKMPRSCLAQDQIIPKGLRFLSSSTIDQQTMFIDLALFTGSVIREQERAPCMHSWCLPNPDFTIRLPEVWFITLWKSLLQSSVALCFTPLQLMQGRFHELACSKHVILVIIATWLWAFMYLLAVSLAETPEVNNVYYKIHHISIYK